jgi:hypothetical protein
MLSVSSILSYKACRRRFYYSWLLGLQRIESQLRPLMGQYVDAMLGANNSLEQFNSTQQKQKAIEIWEHYRN